MRNYSFMCCFRGRSTPIGSFTFQLLLMPISVMTLLMSMLSAAWAGPLPAVHDEQDLGKRLLGQPVVVYNRPYTAPCFADYVPNREEVNKDFAFAMARNEYEPMQVGLYVPRTAKALADVQIEVQCDIPSRIGYIYYQPEKELGWLKDMPMDRGKPWQGKRAVLPLYVMPLDRLGRIEPGHSGSFWITFQTDSDIVPGSHEGLIKLRASGKLLSSIRFAIEVHPFFLPRPKTIYTMYYAPYQTPPAFQGLKYQRMYLADMAAHGANAATPLAKGWTSTSSRRYCDNYMQPGDYLGGAGYNAIRFIEAQLRLGREVGLVQRDRPVVTQPSNYATKGKDNVLHTLRKFAVAKGWPDFYMYMRDEPGPKVFETVIEHLAQWQRHGAKTIAAISGTAAVAVGHVHDVWTVLAGHFTPELIAECRRQGAQLWAYHHNFRTTNAELGRYFSGLYTWSLDLAGNMPYAYMGEPGSRPELQAQPFFDANWKLSAPSILGYVIPSPSGPVPGVGFEGRREGIDDLRYLQLLEARLALAPAALKIAVTARNWLAQLRRDTRPLDFSSPGTWQADWLDPHPGLTPSDYDAIRIQAAAYIQMLPPAENERNAEPKHTPPVSPPAAEWLAFADQNVQTCIAALKSSNVKKRRQAAAALSLRRPEQIQPARAALIALLDDPEVRVPALRASYLPACPYRPRCGGTSCPSHK